MISISLNARPHLTGGRLLVEAPLPARGPLEVFDGIRHVRDRAIDPGPGEPFVEYAPSLVESVIEPRVHAALADPVRTPGPYLIEGRVEVEQRDVRLIVSGVMPFHQRRSTL